MNENDNRSNEMPIVKKISRAKIPLKSIILSIAFTFLGIFLGTIITTSNYSLTTQTAYESTENSELSLITTTYFNSQRFNPEEIETVRIISDFGSITIVPHDEDFILTRSGTVVSHNIVIETTLYINAPYSSITVYLPAGEIARLITSANFGNITLSNLTITDFLYSVADF